MLFAAASLVIVVGVGALLAIPFATAGRPKAIEASAVVAVVVQLFAFPIARSFRRELPDWLDHRRSATICDALAYAFVAVKMLGMPAPAALISLVTFFFISSLVEPKLLTI